MTSSELWNVKNLKSPPKLTMKINIQEKDVAALIDLTSEALSTFNDQTDFEKEAALLSRFIYCMKTKLRHNKGLKVAAKINQALLRYLRTNITCQIETFLHTLPRSFLEPPTYMPSRNMLQYLLVRLQGVAKLMVRVVETSKIAAQTFEELISIGHMWKIYFVGFGIVSRIYVLSRDIAKYCCRLYSLLFPFVNVLQNSIGEWLPNEYILPKDLRLWLNADCLDEVDKRVEINKPFLSLFKYEAGDSDDELFVDRITTKQSRTVDALMKSKPEISAEDLGIPVLRKIDTKKQRRKKKRSKCVQPNIQTLDDLKKFENDFKNNVEKYSDNYKKLDKMQCSMLHKLVLKCLKRSTKNVNDPVKVNGYLNEVRKALSVYD
ncbi:hypothetical protein RI129_005706 [Pyrocoelia pectoralis]|uniref:Nucleolus and neural progenitor protein-like N-terminal domain-containing protein n=1 Tax=Pyrocoelia pectoralis TaxID=417401 RepID=A0AAN7ZNN3_9COLE